MTLTLKYLLPFVACAILAGCYKGASDSFIDDGTKVDPVDREEDVQTKAQNRWTYEHMRSDYLWEEFLPDTAALNMAEYPQKFFDRLKYAGDRFSWTEINPDFSGLSVYDRFGIDYALYRTAAGEEVCRLTLAQRSVVAEAGLRRGEWFRITEDAGDRLTITTGSIDGGAFRSQRQISLLALDASQHTEAVMLDTVYHIGDNHIAYLFYNEFIDGTSAINNPYRSELRAVFARFRDEQATDIIIDLRYNPGGHVSICQYLASLMLRDEYLGGISGYHSYNKALAAAHLVETGNEEDILYFAGHDAVGGNNVGLDRAWFIITQRTASASESLINTLSPFLRTTTIGSRSTGKGVGSWTIEDRRYQWKLQPITFRYYNSQHVTVPDEGLTPDIPASDEGDGLIYEIGDVRERLLNIALVNITGGGLRSEPLTSIDYARPVDGFVPERRRTEGYIDNSPFYKQQ
ncbi:MAG: hypothetical protein LBJ58_06480 [Tannerellaceae bacterium]|jgi:hypothetical protein|nr:hypothetical protein [Tannerellaceae bacterium]